MTTKNKNNQVSQIAGNKEIISKATDDLTNYVANYLIENKINLLDAFWIIHNVHRRIIMALAIQWEPQAPLHKTFRMADMAWRNTMKELRKLV